VEIPYAGGFAMSGSVLGKGAERAVFAATELEAGLDKRARTAIACGSSLVAKETLYEEELLNYSFHKKFCQTQVHCCVLAAPHSTGFQRERGAGSGQAAAGACAATWVTGWFRLQTIA
jgi:hypothetical protein